MPKRTGRAPSTPAATRATPRKAVARRLLALAPVLALCVVAGGVAGYALYRPARASSAPESWVGRRLPATPQWTLDGAPWSGPERGRPTVLVFWSTSCPSCLEELPELDILHSLLAGAVGMVGLPMQHDADLVASITSRKGIRWPQLRGETGAPINPLTAMLDVRRVPSLWVVDGDGIIRAERLEHIDDLRARVTQVLAGRP